MNENTLTAFFDELYSIEKEASVKMQAMRGLVKLRRGARAAESAYNTVGSRTFETAAKVVPPDKLQKAALKGTEILHKLYA